MYTAVRCRGTWVLRASHSNGDGSAVACQTKLTKKSFSSGSVLPFKVPAIPATKTSWRHVEEYRGPDYVGGKVSNGLPTVSWGVRPGQGRLDELVPGASPCPLIAFFLASPGANPSFLHTPRRALPPSPSSTASKKTRPARRCRGNPRLPGPGTLWGGHSV